MCGGGNDATREAQRAEDERQQQIARSTAAIDRAFAGRGSQVDDFAAALRANFAEQIDKEKQVADRRLKFGLARGGLTGGSLARDAGKELGDEFISATLKGEQSVQDSVARLLAADEQSRLNLIGLAQGGAGLASASQNAANALRVNLSNAQSDGLLADLGDIFTNTRSLFTRQEEAAARRRGLAEANPFAPAFSRGEG